MRFFTREELKQFRYKCSHKLAVSLSVGAVYLFLVTLFFLNKAMKNTPSQDRIRNYIFAAAGYVLLVVLIGMIVRRSQSLNFSRFLRGCVEFDNFEYMLEYVELRMPGPFSPRFLKYPLHLMILGKVLEQSKKPENAETGRRMIGAAADRDPALEALREAPLAEVMEYHKTFLNEHQEMIREWHNDEKFHGMLVHFILPVVIIVGVLSFILKGCSPPVEDDAKPAGSKTDASALKAAEPQTEAGDKTGDVPEKPDAAPQAEAGDKTGDAPEKPDAEPQTEAE
jgi:hypothetical protein